MSERPKYFVQANPSGSAERAEECNSCRKSQLSKVKERSKNPIRFAQLTDSIEANMFPDDVERYPPSSGHVLVVDASDFDNKLLALYRELQVKLLIATQQPPTPVQIARGQELARKHGLLSTDSNQPT
jgi:hypothetical protein